MENEPLTALTLSDIEPGIEKLNAIANECRSLTIAGPSDVAGYDRVHEARMNLRKLRITIKNKCEEKRADAVKFQKDIIAFQNKHIAIIEPVEDALAAQEQAIDREREKIKRSALMPARLERLATIDHIIDPQDGAAGAEEYDQILSMDDAEFEKFFNQQHSLFLQAKELKMKEEQEKRDREAEEARVKAEQDAKAEADRKVAEAEASRKATMPKRRMRLHALGTVTFTDDEILPLDDVQFEAYFNGRVAEKNRIEAERVEAARKKAEDDRIAAEKAETDRKAAEAKAKEDAERHELEKKEAEERGRREAEEKAKAEKEAADRKAAEEKANLLKNTRFNEFMKKHGADVAPAGEFRVERVGDNVTLYKRVESIIL